MQWNSSVNAGFTSGTPWLPITANTDSEHVNVEVSTMVENLAILLDDHFRASFVYIFLYLYTEERH